MQLGSISLPSFRVKMPRVFEQDYHPPNPQSFEKRGFSATVWSCLGGPFLLYNLLLAANLFTPLKQNR